MVSSLMPLFSLSPYKISELDLQEMTELTAPFSELMISISQNWDFLEHHLETYRQYRPIFTNADGLQNG